MQGRALLLARRRQSLRRTRGFGVGGCEMQKDTIACVFFGLDMEGGAYAEQPMLITLRRTGG